MHPFKRSIPTANAEISKAAFIDKFPNTLDILPVAVKYHMGDRVHDPSFLVTWKDGGEVVLSPTVHSLQVVLRRAVICVPSISFKF